MEFSPFNKVVQLCLQGMEMEEKGNPPDALILFHQGLDQATDDFEKFLASFYIARNQNDISQSLKWLETSLDYALKVNDVKTKSALPSLYLKISECYKQLANHVKSKENNDLAIFFTKDPSDKGPFYHGTKANLNIGDILNAGGNSNYRSDFIMNHVYFTALVNGAGLAAALAKGDGPERVYIIQPTGAFENDPNVTDKKFPGNPTRSYRSEFPLKIIGEINDWNKPNPGEMQKFRAKLNNNNGEIIN